MERIEIGSQDELPGVAARIIDLLEGRTVVAFYGPMGAGKTTLIREICRCMATHDNATSPTFALVNQYLTVDGKLIYHFDFYRIDSLAEALDIGTEEYFYSGDLCLVEWPEKVEGLLPEDTGTVRIIPEPADTSRRTFEIE